LSWEDRVSQPDHVSYFSVTFWDNGKEQDTQIELEEKSAAKALELASRTGDPLVSMLLRQIASDSMRHADILSTLLKTVGEEGVSTGHDYRTLRERLTSREAGRRCARFNKSRFFHSSVDNRTPCEHVSFGDPCFPPLSSANAFNTLPTSSEPSSGKA